MDLAETGAYLAHECKLACRADTLHSDDSLPRIHQVSLRLVPGGLGGSRAHDDVAVLRRLGSGRRPLHRLDVTDEAHFIAGSGGSAVDGRQILQLHLRKRGTPVPQAHVGLGDNFAIEHRARVEFQHTAVIVGDAVAKKHGRALIAGQFPGI